MLPAAWALRLSGAGRAVRRNNCSAQQTSHLVGRVGTSSGGTCGRRRISHCPLGGEEGDNDELNDWRAAQKAHYAATSGDTHPVVQRAAKVQAPHAGTTLGLLRLFQSAGEQVVRIFCLTVLLPQHTAPVTAQAGADQRVRDQSNRDGARLRGHGPRAKWQPAGDTARPPPPVSCLLLVISVPVRCCCCSLHMYSSGGMPGRPWRSQLSGVCARPSQDVPDGRVLQPARDGLPPGRQPAQAAAPAGRPARPRGCRCSGTAFVSC